MGSAAIIQLISGMLAIVSVAGGVATAVFSRKDSRERKAERERIESERLRNDADRDKISAEAAEVALRSLRKELDAAYTDIERRRKVMVVQDKRIDDQDRIIRAQNRRIEALEEWITEARAKLEQKGIDGLPEAPECEHEELNNDDAAGSDIPDVASGGFRGDTESDRDPGPVRGAKRSPGGRGKGAPPRHE